MHPQLDKLRARPRPAIALAILAVISIAMFSTLSWYVYRVDTELTPRSWRAPTEILDRNGKTLVALYGTEWRVAEPVTPSELPSYIRNAFIAA
jgi:membrane peptidoglycan carboxypeptidase